MHPVRLSALFAIAAVAPATFAAECQSLTGLKLPDTTIVSAEQVAAGAFVAPNTPAAQQRAFQSLPAFCRVAAELKPTADSDIKIEVWMPLEKWNGKFMGVGNGGWSGAIVYPALSMALNHGYATASTNTGHDGATADFAAGHPEKLVDFGYRAVHEMTVKGKAITEAFYSKAPQKAYWNGCSSGGKQGLKEAQKFPLDYDAIVAGAPANYWTHLMAGDLWPAVVTHKVPGASLPEPKLRTLHNAAIEACDALDGVKDGLIGDPSRCHFDPGVLLCKGADSDSCLTAAQVSAAQAIYAGAANPRTKKQIFPGMAPGSELVWSALAGPSPFGIPLSHFQVVVFKDPKWDYLTLDFDKDVALADQIDNGLLNATDPNLKSFFAHGGKLLMYHGWNDQLISPFNSVNYYESVAKTMGGTAQVNDSFRLFMAPAMNHCGGGDGPSSIDVFTPIDDWVMTGKAPDQMVARHLTGTHVDRSRPLCPYPQVAKYKGSGSIDEAANFACFAPGK
jgi:feruloyl esterase